MHPRTRSFAVAGGGGLSALATLAFSWYTLASVSGEPRGDGFAAGLAAAFGLVLGVAAVFVVASAAILAVAERYAALRPGRRLALQLGNAANVVGTASLFLGAGLLLLPRSFGIGVPMAALRLFPYTWGAWALLVLGGTAMSALGGLWTLGDALKNRWSSRSSV
jgi:hypothetical protein